jgi:RHS repeat-associated protein
MTTPRGGVYEWTFDSLSRNTSISDPNGRTTTYDFDPAGQRLRQTNPDGSWLDQSYDPVGRPIHLDRSDGTFVDRAYDFAGNLIRATTEKTELSFIYNQINSRVQETLSFPDAGFAATAQYVYDEEGNLTGVTDATGRVLTYVYDLAGNLQSLSDDAGGPTATFTMSGFGDRESISFGNGTLGSHTFDKSGRVASIDWGASIAQFVYNRDAAGNAETITESVGGVAEALTAVYDVLNRPTTVGASVNPGLRAETFTYDMNGNHTLDRGGNSVSYDLAEQPMTGGPTLFQHDAQGNRTSAVDAGGNGIETVYDPSNRLTTSRTLVGGNVTGEIQYTYDAIDRLVEIADGSTVRRILYTHRNPLNEFDAGGTPQVSYTMGAEIDDVLGAMVSGGVRYLHLDAVGSVRALTNAAGATVASRNYGQYGRVVSETGIFDVQLGFTGRLIVSATGLVDLRARWYDPTLGAFLGKDPLPFPLSADSPNPYTYAANRPGLMIDPLGLTPSPLWPDLFGAAGATQLALRENIRFWDPVSRAWETLRYNNLPGQRLTPGNLFAISRDGKFLRLDYGAHGNLTSAQWHWNGKGIHSRFGVFNHQPALGFGGQGRVGSMLNTIGNARGARAALGRGLVVVGAGMDIYTVATSDTPIQTGAEKVGAWAGAYGGAKAFGAGGAAIGSFAGPIGTAVGGVGGAIVGGVAGYFFGEKAVQTVWGWFD